MSNRQLNKCAAACAIALAGLGAVSAANAARYVGSWDPLYGSPFLANSDASTVTDDDMWWSGTALFDTGTCVADANNLMACAGMTVSAAEVVLSVGESGAEVDRLNFSGVTALTKVQLNANGTVAWVETGWWDPLAAGEGDSYNLSRYLFSLSFSQQGANLFHIAKLALDVHGGHGPDQNTYFWKGEGEGHANDLCQPTTAPDGDECGFSNAYGSMQFELITEPGTLIPEPGTYALMFTGLGAAFMFRRRRHCEPALECS